MTFLLVSETKKAVIFTIQEQMSCTAVFIKFLDNVYHKKVTYHGLSKVSMEAEKVSLLFLLAKARYK